MPPITKKRNISESEKLAEESNFSVSLFLPSSFTYQFTISQVTRSQGMVAIGQQVQGIFDDYQEKQQENQPQTRKSPHPKKGP